jgi:hypothetical protein
MGNRQNAAPRGCAKSARSRLCVGMRSTKRVGVRARRSRHSPAHGAMTSVTKRSGCTRATTSSARA